MLTKKPYIILFLCLLPQLAFMQFFCSAFCGYDQCSGPTNSSCTGCDYPFVLIGNTCVPSNGFQIVGYSQDIVPNSTLTSSCGLYNFKGQYTASSRVWLRYTVTEPHYQVHFIAWIILMDNWKLDDNIFVKTISGGSLNLNMADVKILTNFTVCSPSGDAYYKVNQSWAHTSTTADIVIQLSMDDFYNSPWGFKQYTILARLCHANCQQCTGPLNTQCSDCTTGNYLRAATCASTCPSGYGYPLSPSKNCIVCGSSCTQCYHASANCSKCSATTFLNQVARTCNPSCPLFTGPNTSDRICYSCADNTNCQICTSNISQCTQCVSSKVLFNATCQSSCPPGYLNITGTCTNCHQTCAVCTGITANDCSACSNLYPFLSGILCNAACMSGYGYPAAGFFTCVSCNSLCLNCSVSATNCSSCVPAAYHKPDTNQCVAACPPVYFSIATVKICNRCETICASCANSMQNCTSCFSSHVFFNNSCYTSCPKKYYNNSNFCDSCHSNCQECTGYPSPCSYCTAGFFLANLTCGPSCPAGYFPYQLNRTCLECSIFCVQATIDAYFPNPQNPKNIYVDISFSKAMNFSNFPYQSFQSFKVLSDQISIDKLSFEYKIIDQTKYRIIVSITRPANLTNVQVMCSTLTISPDYKSAQGLPLDTSAYSQSDSVLWTVIKYPQLQGSPRQFVGNLSIFNNWLINITTTQYVQQIHKTGIFALLFSGAQMTSLAALRSKMPPQNMYEGCRFWAMFIYFDVPDWELDSNKTKYIVVPSSDQVIASSRLLMDVNQIQFRFRRTGFTSFFLLDCYVNIILLAVAWIALLVAYLLSRKFAFFKKHLSFFYSVVHRIHEISLFYVVIASVLQWSYFEPTSAQRIGSIIMNVIFLVYFLTYHLFIYREMISYPLVAIGEQKYNQYVQKYGYFLKNIRYEHYSRKQQSCCYFPYLRPYNFHLFSFYKKVLMLAALPLFYGIDYAQMSVLTVIQITQICRVIIVRPFYKPWRNVTRVLLEVVLFLFLLLSLIDQKLLNDIALDLNQATVQQLEIYENVGWAEFGLIFLFNIGYLALMIFDLVTGCIWNNQYRIDQARKLYYLSEFQQLDANIQKEQQRNQLLVQKTMNTPKSMAATPKTVSSFRSKNSFNSYFSSSSKYSQQQKHLIKKWIKSGNLIEKQDDQINVTKAKIEQYKIQKYEQQQAYHVKIYRAFELYVRLKAQKNKQKNITTTEKLEKQIVLTKNPSCGKFQVSPTQSLPTVNNPFFYKIVNELYAHYQQLTTESIYVKTFMHVDLSNHQLGQQIQIREQDMFQVIVQESFSKSRNIQKLQKPYKPFPIQRKIIESLK